MKKVKLMRGFTEIKDLWHIIQKHNCHIIGGYARYCASPNKYPVKTKDIDIYCITEENYNNIVEEFKKLGLVEKHSNSKSITFAKNDLHFVAAPIIQVVKPIEIGKVKTNGSIDEILDNFDFTIARALIINENECLVDDDFEEHEKQKKLVLKNIHCPVGSLFRCIKYIKKGYFLKPTEALKLFVEWDSRDTDYKQKLLNFLLEKNKKDVKNISAIYDLMVAID